MTTTTSTQTTPRASPSSNTFNKYGNNSSMNGNNHHHHPHHTHHPPHHHHQKTHINLSKSPSPILHNSNLNSNYRPRSSTSSEHYKGYYKKYDHSNNYGKENSSLRRQSEYTSDENSKRIQNHSYKSRKKREQDNLFISQYIKSNELHTTLNDHQLYFHQINKERKLKSLEIYKKYLNNEKDNYHLKSNVNDYYNNYNYEIRNKKKLISPVIQNIKDENKYLSIEPSISPKNIQPVKKPHTVKNEFIEKYDTKDQLKEPSTSKTKIIIQKLPLNYMDCPIDYLILLISRMLSSLISLNDKSVPTSISNPPTSSNGNASTSNNLLTRYHSRTPPGISTFTYLTRLTKFNNFNSANLLTIIYYIDLLSHQYQPFFTLNSWTVHRFLLVATMISQKCIEDFFYTNSHYAKVGGVAISELNCLELDFLNRVDWKLIPSKQKILKNQKNNTIVNDISVANDVLNLYYFQLIELMGKNIIHDEKNYFEINNCLNENNDKNIDKKKIFYHFVKLQDNDNLNDLKSRSSEEKSSVYSDDEIDEDEDEEEEEGFYDSDDDSDVEDDDENMEDEFGGESEGEETEIEISNTNSKVQDKYLNLPQISKQLYDKNGNIINNSSSPHLKRRYSSE
ncbi:PHO80 [Candida pseudojiufengensis]|uniref:PHO80 n=1 Tax=Candida pseudojiufengensis TaxID=497109 RepID=UPI002224E20D|nr:PHO80 [Candida pseudojiufengensis]KAI5965395.1 PHO80 [Candida pseudojiufengensis]